MAKKYNASHIEKGIRAENEEQNISSGSIAETPASIDYGSSGNDHVAPSSQELNSSDLSATDSSQSDDSISSLELPPGLAAMPKPMDIHHVMSTVPPEINWMIEGWLRHDTYVGQIFGEQQTGKSFLLLVICSCLACGRTYGPFTITRPWRVSIFNVEDSRTQIHLRLKSIVQALEFSEEEIELIHQNLILLPWLGRFGTINGPNAATNELKRIEEIIETFEPDLLVGDTKSRLCHGRENSNDDQAGFVRTLERLVIEYGGPFILTHHTAKSSGKNPRGASAWPSNIRLSINLSKMAAEEAHRFGLKPEKAADRAFTLTSDDNYGGKCTAYFFKDEHTGVPREITPKYEAGQLVQQWLLEKLPENEPVSRRALIGNRPGDDEAAAAMLASYPADVIGDKKELIKAAVTALLEAEQIFQYKVGKATMLTMQPPKPAPDAKPADAADDTPATPLLPVPQRPGRRSLRRNLGGDAADGQANTANA